MGKIFSYDSKFFEVLERTTNIVVLNFLIIIFSIPIITIGPTLSASYSVALKMANGEDPKVFSEFIKRFKQDFKISTVVWMLLILLGIVLSVDFYFSNMISNKTISDMFRFIFTIASVILMFIFTYVFALISKFDNTVKNTLKNSILISIQNLPYTIIMVIVNLLPIITMFLFTNQWANIILFYMVIGFGVILCVNSIFLNKILDKYVS